MDNEKHCTVLVTGSSGNLGAKVVGRLLQDERCRGVIGIDPMKSPPNIGNNPLFEPLDISLTDMSSDLEDAVSRSEIVVHFAAKNPHPDADWQDAAESFDMTANLVGLAARHSKRFVFASSNHVMGGYKETEHAAMPGALTTDLSPLAGTRVLIGGEAQHSVSYATTKLMGERLCFSAARMTDLEAICLRIGWCLPPPNDPNAISSSGSSVTPQTTPETQETAQLKWFRDMWLSDRDLVETFAAACFCDHAPWKDTAICLNAMSANTGSPWNIEDNEALIGYRPQDDVRALLSTSVDPK